MHQYNDVLTLYFKNTIQKGPKMSLKMTPKSDQNEPRDRPVSETPPGGAQKPQNLLKPTKTPPGKSTSKDGKRRLQESSVKVMH